MWQREKGRMHGRGGNGQGLVSINAIVKYVKDDDEVEALSYIMMEGRMHIIQRQQERLC